MQMKNIAEMIEDHLHKGATLVEAVRRTRDKQLLVEVDQKELKLLMSATFR